MAEAPKEMSGPDLSQGVAIDSIADQGTLLGHVGEDAVLLVRRGGELFAIDASCSHYGGPLADGIVAGETVRCPWHHACFDLRTGRALRAPALNDLRAWRVERRDGMAFVREPLPGAPSPALPAEVPTSVVIIGGGAAGQAAAEMLRREGYAGPVTMISADTASPVDRPNLSKDYLAGTAQEDWIPLRPPEFYAEHEIDLRLGVRVDSIEPAGKSVSLSDGSRIAYAALLLATGAEPRRLDVPGAHLPHVHLLRTLADCNGLIAGAEKATRCVVVGASFIGLEVAASLRTRGLSVHVVAPEARPMERVMGAAIGDMLRSLHERQGVVFHLGTTIASIAPDRVVLQNGETIEANLVVVGIGVRPVTDLAEQAGLAVDRGVVVDEYLRTSAAGIWAAGDIARWPDMRSGQRIRVEHWVVAERQGQVAARNMLGRDERFDAVPFFWTRQYDTSVDYVGHADIWDRAEVDGDPAAQDCTVTLLQGSRKLAVVTVGRDRDSLRTEAALESRAATAP